LPGLQIFHRIRVNRNAYGVSPLVRRDFRIDALLWPRLAWVLRNTWREVKVPRFDGNTKDSGLRPSRPWLALRSRPPYSFDAHVMTIDRVITSSSVFM